ncbi:MFS transporter [Paraclostridium bifermentans]|jgi:fucose permease|uniref:MFS transporter n=1 Tax=Paraclostridium bifermentans TaxID=1490 RepID=UPI00189FCD6B|nr:MFS transporter [Paraclostridium bifermentans]
MFSLLLAVIYLAFISLGLPDSLLGSVWPTIYQEFNVPVSYAGAIFMIISAGTIFSSLQSDRLTKSLGTGKVTAFSVLMTAVALFGFSISHSYWMLVLWAIPYGLGAGSVDASLNNYVALHYKSHHMSWLHCMWGVGASIGPYIMSFALVNGQTWNMGYRYISLIQVALTIIIMLSLPLWKKRPVISDIQEAENGKDKVLTLKEIFNIPGAKQLMLMFFCYCALEQTAGLWASSYLVLQHGFDLEVATSYGSLFFIGITVGRAISGFITMKLNDKQMIYLGQGLILIGIIIMCLPLGHQVALMGLVTIGLGCAPIYPCIIHSTPSNFGKDKSQAIIGVQMASAYVGNLLMPPLFGIIANHISAIVFPIYLLLILIVMVVMHIKLNKSVSKNILIN